jgi:hypothetical protein
VNDLFFGQDCQSLEEGFFFCKKKKTSLKNKKLSNETGEMCDGLSRVIYGQQRQLSANE